MAKSELNATEWEVKRSMSQGHGDPHAFGVVFTLFSICLAFYGIYLFFKRLSDYNLSKTNFEEYQKQVIKERDKKAAAEIAHINAQIKKEMANRPKCPQCGSHNTEKISTLNRATSVAATGLASNKIGKLYKCKDCKHMW